MACPDRTGRSDRPEIEQQAGERLRILDLAQALADLGYGPADELELLVDGAQALPRIAAALREARSHVHLAGWHFSPDFALERDGPPTVYVT